MADITIKLTDADAGTVKVSRGDKITWHNGSGATISLKPPLCVTPRKTETIEDGDDGMEHTVRFWVWWRTYEYTFSVGKSLAPRMGRIKV